MPYRRKKFYKKSRKGYRKRYSKKLKFTVKKIMNQQLEKKYSITSVNTTITNAGSIWSISDVAQGDTDLTRDGDQLYIRSIECEIRVTAGDPTNVMRIIVLQWIPNSTPNVSSILIDATTYGEMSPWTHDTRFLFRILYDKRFYVNTTTMGNREHKTVLKRIKFRKMQFESGATTGTNKLYVLAISDSAAATHPILFMVTKLNFSDP